MFKLFLALAFGFLFLLPVAAQDYKTVDDFFEDIPSLNEELQSNEIILPKPAGFLINNGNVLVEIIVNDGALRDFYFSIENRRIVSILEGKPEKSRYIISTNEETANSVLASEDKAETLLSHYKNKKIEIKAVGFGNKIKLSLAKMSSNFFNRSS